MKEDKEEAKSPSLIPLLPSPLPQSPPKQEQQKKKHQQEQQKDQEIQNKNRKEQTVVVIDSSKRRRKKRIPSRVTLLHSDEYTLFLYKAMGHINKDRDILLSSLLRFCGFLVNTPNFWNIIAPQKATRNEIEDYFHDAEYLNLLECSNTKEKEKSITSNMEINKDENDDDLISLSLLEEMGLVEDCALPPSNSSERFILWKYCQYVAGASLQAADCLLSLPKNSRSVSSDVSIHWGGGRHHADPRKASGFCFINDVCLAINHMLKYNTIDSSTRILYLDIDIHHGDGVQRAFYDSESVLTVSLHRYAPGFFPAVSGNPKERGKYGTKGVGYNLNLPVPPSCDGRTFVHLFRYALRRLSEAYDPHFVVLCVGADGLKDDPIVTETDHGWNLTPEALAECVRFTSELCAANRDDDDDDNNEINRITKNDDQQCSPQEDSNNRQQPISNNNRSENDVSNKNNITTPNTDCIKRKKKRRRRRKLLVLGGGGYHPANTARTYLLCTAAACEGARSGMLRSELPSDIPKHQYFPRYGPEFILYNKEEHDQYFQIDKNDKCFPQLLRQSIDLACTFLSSKQQQHNREPNFSFQENEKVLLPSPARKAEKRKIGDANSNNDERKKGGGRRRRKRRPTTASKPI